MSLDLYLECPHCGRYDLDWNYTYNVSPMWYAVYPNSKGMIDIEGLTGEESLDKLIFFANELRNNPNKFRAMNPKNGWGSYDTFLKSIEQLINAAKQNPKGMWRASR